MYKLLAKWTLSPMMTLSATIRAFFWLIRNGLIHFVMDPICCRSSGSLAPSLGVWSEIRTCNLSFSLLSSFLVSYSTMSYIIAFLSTKMFVNVFFLNHACNRLHFVRNRLHYTQKTATHVVIDYSMR